MQRFLGRYAEQIYAMMRIVMGFFFSCHGAQKILGMYGGERVPLVSQMGLGGIIELVGGILIAIGFLTSWAAFISSGQMAVAYFQFHSPGGFWPVQNHGELAVVYAFVFLYIAARGSGIWSVSGPTRNPSLS